MMFAPLPPKSGTPQKSAGPLEAERDKAFHKMYISNVGDRLRELENPSDIDCKRWAWELMQNAKDCVSDPNKTVDIELTVQNNEVSFRHNGPPFNGKTLLALLYKYSEGKRNNAESTGRFGTGFLTTHTLSKVVKLEGDLIDPNSPKGIQGFQITMYRDGQDDEDLRQGMERMEKEKKFYPGEPNGWTVFTYILKKPRNFESSKLGFNNFKQNIALTMLFNPKFGTVRFNFNSTQTTINRISVEKQDKISLITFQLKCEDLKNTGNATKEENLENQEEKKITYIVCSIEEPSKELSAVFRAERNLRLAGCIQCKENNDLFYNEETPCLFCSLPLVGSEKHILPIILNSNDFEPMTERNGILLKGDEFQLPPSDDESTEEIKIPANDKILSYVGRNFLILKRSLDIFEHIVNFCSEQQYKRLFVFTRGLRDIPDVNTDFDPKWYKTNMMIPMRLILMKYPLVYTDKGLKKIKEVFFPIYPKEATDEYKRQFHFYTQQFFGLVPCFEESLEWSDRIWQDDESKTKLSNYINERKLLESFKEKERDNEITNSFIKFAWEYHQALLKDIKVLKNQNGDFVLYKDNFATDSTDSEKVIQCIEELGFKWKENHLDRNIISIQLPLVHDQQYALGIIKKQDPPDKTFLLTKYIIEGNEKRELIYKYGKIFFPSKIGEKQIVSEDSFDLDIWNKSDNDLISKMISIVIKYSKISEVPFQDNLYNDFLLFLEKYCESKRNVFNQYALIPNQKGMFCKLKYLYNDKNIPSPLKDVFRIFGVELEPKLKMESIGIQCKNNLTITSLIEEMPKYFHSQNLDLTKKIQAAGIIVGLLPNDESFEGYSEQFQIQELYYKIAQKVQSANKVSCLNKAFWHDANDIIIDFCQSKIQESKSLSNLSRLYNITDIEYFTIIKTFYNKFNPIKYQIIANEEGTFKNIDKLYAIKDVEQPILDLYVDFNPHFYDTIIHHKFDWIKMEVSKILTLDFFINYFDKNPSLEIATRVPNGIIFLLPPKETPLFDKQAKLYEIWEFLNSFQKVITSNKSLNSSQKVRTSNLFKYQVSLQDVNTSYRFSRKNIQPNSTKMIKCSDERFWNSSNQLIYQEIIKKVNSFESFSKIECNEDELISKLNLCYSVISNKDIKVPDRNGVFHETKQIQSCQNIDKTLLKLYKMTTGIDLSQKLLHLKIINNYIKPYNTKEFISVIVNSLTKVDDSKEDNSRVEALQKEIFGDINNLKFGHFNINDNSLFGELSENIIYEMYAKQIQNTFHNQFPPSTRRRWGWELMQNATDSIDQPNQTVSIWYNFYDDRVEFIHNGSPFTNEQLWSLVCMYSKKDSNSIGKFGTGFTSTHILSKIVEIETNMKDKGQIMRKRITLYRDGKYKDDYIQGIKKTMNEIKILDEQSDKTKFIYRLRNKDSQNAAKEGIQELIHNLPRVFVFNSRLENVTISIDQNCSYYNEINDDQNPKPFKFEFKRGEIHEIDDKEKKISIYENENEHTFIISSINILHPQNRSTILIEGAIEIHETEDNKTIIQKERNDFDNDVFLTFPLIGFEKFNFPFSIQCNHFLSTVEREALDLNKINEPRNNINGTILESSIEIFKRLIGYFSRNQYSNLFVILKKLQENSFIKLINDDSFKREIQDYYQNKILNPMIDYFLSLPVIITSKGFKKIYQPQKLNLNRLYSKYDFDLSTNEAIIWKNNEDENYFKLISLFVNTYPESTIIDEWESSLSPIKSHYIFKLQHLIDKFENINKLEDVQLFTNDSSKINAIDQLISFAKDKTNFRSFKIIPAQDETFHTPKDIKSCGIDHEILEILENDFGISYKSQIIHSEINSFSPESILSYNDIEDDITNCFKNSQYSDSQKIKLAIQILTTYPQDQEIEDKIIKIYCTIKPEMENLFSQEKSEHFKHSDIYKEVYNCLILDINLILDQFKEIKEIENKSNLSEEDVCKLLNEYYEACFEYYKRNKSTIEQKNFVLPNDEGTFIKYQDTMSILGMSEQSIAIEDELYQLSALLYKEKEWRKMKIHKMIMEEFAYQRKSLDDLVIKMDTDIYNLYEKKEIEKNIDLFQLLIFTLNKNSEFNDIFPEIISHFYEISQAVNKISVVHTNEIQILLAEREADKRKIRTLMEEKDKLMHDNQDIIQQNNQHILEKQKLIKEKQELLNANNHLQQENHSLRKQIDKLNQEINEYNIKNEELIKENEALKEENCNLRHQLNEHKKGIQSLKQLLSPNYVRPYTNRYSNQGFYYYTKCYYYSPHPERQIAYEEIKNCPKPLFLSVLKYLANYIKGKIQNSPIKSVYINNKYSCYLKEQFQDFSNECDDFDICVQYTNDFKSLIRIVATHVSEWCNIIPVDYEMANDYMSEIIPYNKKNFDMKCETILMIFWGNPPDIQNSLEIPISKLKSFISNYLN